MTNIRGISSIVSSTYIYTSLSRPLMLTHKYTTRNINKTERYNGNEQTGLYSYRLLTMCNGNTYKEWGMMTKHV